MFRKIIFGYLFILLVSCLSDSNGGSIKQAPKAIAKSSDKNLNISFLLDLSDRISPEKYPNQAMEYYMRDVSYIKSVSEAFVEHLSGKKVIKMDDKIQLFFDPEPKNQNINALSEDLRFHVNRNNASLEILNEINELYTAIPVEIYELAIVDNAYVGSDTWRFFKSKVKDYCVEEGYRNILVILTDGYIYHKDTKINEENRSSYITPQYIRSLGLNNNDWKSKMENDEIGFIPATSELANLDILVVGINPDPKNPYEEDVIMKYWSDWFNAMNVHRYEIKTAGLPTNMDRIIKDFILDK